MTSGCLSRPFCLRMKTTYLFLKLMEAFRLVSEERPELHVISGVTRKTLESGLKAPPDKVLLLLPHCLQHHDCPHRITFSIGNCARCGRCVVGSLAELAEKTGVEAVVTTGGTLARRLIAERLPSVVIAVACPRDLGQGIIDSLPLPALGVLNLRPNGDCFDTTVSVDKVRDMIERVVSGERISTGEGCNPSEGKG